MPDRKANRSFELLIKKIIPFCDVQEDVLTHRGNIRFMSSDARCLFKLGVTKLKMMAYHLECNGIYS